MSRRSTKNRKHIIISDSDSQSQKTPQPRKRRKMDNNEQLVGLIKFQTIQAIKSGSNQTQVTQQTITPWLLQSTKSVDDSLLRLHNQVIDFYSYIKPSQKQHNLRFSAFEEIQNIILKIFPMANVEIFGSFATKLYLPDGDIDIAVLTNNKYEVTTVYNKIHKALQNDPVLFTQLQYIRKSKVPLIKFLYSKQNQSDIQFDISVDKPDGILQVDYVNKINKKYPQFKYIVFVFKCFLKIRGLGQTYSGGVGSFLLFCMILFYLIETHQRRKYYNLGEHIYHFMRFYGDTQWHSKVIDIKSGKTYSRRKFEDNSAFSCISPQDDSHDIGKAAFKIRDVFNTFRNRSRYLFGKNFEPRQSILRTLVNPQEEQFRYFRNRN